MKKTLIAALALVTLAACKNEKETHIESDKTVIETPTDTMTIDTDTISEDGDGQAMEVEVQGSSNLKVEYASFGDKIAADKALTNEQMFKKYKSLKAGDTVNVKFKSEITGVCQKKGCWMTLALPGDQSTFVKFKDYAFFVPLNATEQEAIVSGKAFVSETSVAELKHYAKDAGKSDAEIAKITKPEVKYGFMADGVLISK